MTREEFIEHVNDPHNILPKGIPAQEAIDIIAEYLFGDVMIDGYSCSQEQWNTEVVAAIMDRYHSYKHRERIKHWFRNFSIIISDMGWIALIVAIFSRL